MIKNLGPIRVKTIVGEPIHIASRTLMPVTRVTAALRHRGTVRQTTIEGRGQGWASIRPIAVIENRDGVERVFRIWDLTRVMLIQMAVLALVVPVIALVVIIANRLVRRP